MDASSDLPPVDPRLLADAVELTREAGEVTLSYFRRSDLEVSRKSDGTPVTVADREAERLLRLRLAERCPEDSVLGEEEEDLHGSSGRRWIIDPIDGTKAFAHGVPLYTNLLAFEDEHGPAIGVINMPALGETLWAGRGHGCFLDGSRVQVSDRVSLSGAWLTTSSLSAWPDGLVGRLLDAGAHLRTWGDGYGYALVASGRLDAMLDPVAALWDLAPMPVILAESGGRFTSVSGEPSPGAGSGLATNGLLHDQIIDLLP